jgi:hypothetical protein
MFPFPVTELDPAGCCDAQQYEAEAQGSHLGQTTGSLAAQPGATVAQVLVLLRTLFPLLLTRCIRDFSDIIFSATVDLKVGRFLIFSVV